MQVLFCRYFSIQGRSIKILHERWRDFKFDPNTDVIEVFISDVKHTTHQLSHNEVAVLNLIQVCIHIYMYVSLYPVQELDVAVAMVKDILHQKTLT